MALNFGLLKSRDQYNAAGELEVTQTADGSTYDGDKLKVTMTPDGSTYDGDKLKVTMTPDGNTYSGDELKVTMTPDGNTYSGDDLQVTHPTDNQNYDGSGNLETVDTSLNFTGDELQVTKIDQPLVFIPIYVEKAVWDDDLDVGAVMNMGDFDTTTYLGNEDDSSVDKTKYLSADFQTLLTDVIVNCYFSVMHDTNSGACTVYLETSTDDSNWTTRSTLQAVYNSTVYKSYSGKISFRYLRLRVYYNHTGSEGMAGRINELRIYQEAS